MNEKAVAQPKKVTAGQYLKKNWPLYVMLLIPMAYVILFKYVPMAGLAIAFKDFNVFKGIWGSEWVGFKYFIEAFNKVGVFGLFLCKGRNLDGMVDNECGLNEMLFNKFFEEEVENVTFGVVFFIFNVMFFGSRTRFFN